MRNSIALFILAVVVSRVAVAAVDRVFFQELLEIPSVTADIPAVNRAVELTRAWLERNGVRLQRMLANTDARHFAGLGVPVVIVGFVGENAHGKDEWGDLKNMDENADSLVEFLNAAGEIR